MRTRGMRAAALLALALLCAAMLPGAALADQPVAFSEWIESFENPDAPAQEAPPELPLIAPQAQLQAARPVGIADIAAAEPAPGPDADAAAAEEAPPSADPDAAAAESAELPSGEPEKEDPGN